MQKLTDSEIIRLRQLIAWVYDPYYEPADAMVELSAALELYNQTVRREVVENIERFIEDRRKEHDAGGEAKPELTLREVVATCRSRVISDDYAGGVAGCPQDYGLPNRLHPDGDYRECAGEESCQECWSQPYRAEGADDGA